MLFSVISVHKPEDLDDGDDWSRADVSATARNPPRVQRSGVVSLAQSDWLFDI